MTAPARPILLEAGRRDRGGRMATLRWTFRSAALGAAAAALGACSLDAVQPCDAGNLRITAPVTAFTVGQVSQFSANYEYRNCSTAPAPTWSSSNEMVVRVTADGVVTAIGVGSAQVRLTVANRSSAVNVTVAAAQGEPAPR
jgi:hypothetical protein